MQPPSAAAPCSAARVDCATADHALTKHLSLRLARHGPEPLDSPAAVGASTFGHVPSALRRARIACSMAAVAACVARTGFSIMKSWMMAL